MHVPVPSLQLCVVVHALDTAVHDRLLLRLKNDLLVFTMTKWCGVLTFLEGAFDRMSPESDNIIR